ncbi:Ankyrin repeat domain containing protein [Balamuthia mandrillaris]
MITNDDLAPLLPDEMLCEIYAFLPAEWVAMAARVSPSWYRCSPLAHRNAIHLPSICASPWAEEQGCPWEATCVAARAGNKELLLWLRENGCVWGVGTFAATASTGNMGMLQWLLEEGCPWDKSTCREAAAGGHLEALKWLQWARSEGCPWSAKTCSAAARHGHLHVLQWLRKEGCRWDERTIRNAALGGHKTLLRWADFNGCRMAHRICKAAAEGGHLDILWWLRASHFYFFPLFGSYSCSTPWPTLALLVRVKDKANVVAEALNVQVEAGGIGEELILEGAVKAGHLHVLQEWEMLSGAASRCIHLCRRAAAGGHLQVLQWLREKKSPWDEATTAAAAKGGHLEVLKWAWQNGCPWDEGLLQAAAKNDHLETFVWVLEVGCLPTKNMNLSLSENGNRVKKWLERNGYTISNAGPGGSVCYFCPFITHIQ